jgi:hypothetical protein
MAINPEGGFISLDHLPRIVQRATQNGNGLGVECQAMFPADLTRALALSLDVAGQNAPNRMAPTKANAIETTSTFNFTARSADMDL